VRFHGVECLRFCGVCLFESLSNVGHLHCEIALNVRIMQLGFWSKRSDIGCEQSCDKFGSQATI
jgi:hypothetical protein